MTNKIKFNAAQVIKYMDEKELKQYTISLEKDGVNQPSIPKWFEPFAQIITDMSKFMAEQREFNQSVLNQFKKHKWIK